jgi:hypothetical protein
MLVSDILQKKNLCMLRCLMRLAGYSISDHIHAINPIGFGSLDKWSNPV